jgi:hypothetical protein
MDAIFSQLQQNKVTVEIRPNALHELKVFDQTLDPPFCFNTAFSIKKSNSITTPRDSGGKTRFMDVSYDHLIYMDCFWKDKTITLLKPHDVKKQVDTRRAQLIVDLTNEKDLYRKLKFKQFMKTAGAGDVATALSTPEASRDASAVSLIAFYFSQTWKTNVVVNGVIDAVYDLHSPAYVNLDLAKGEMHEHATGFRELVESYLASQNLKQMLVKDIRKLATLFKLPTSKQGTPLLKEQLIHSIHTIYST